MNPHYLLTKRNNEKGPLRVGLIGAGKFGTMYSTQAGVPREFTSPPLPTWSRRGPSKRSRGPAGMVSVVIRVAGIPLEFFEQ